MALLLEVAGYQEAADFLRSRGAIPAMLARLREKAQRYTTLVAQDDFLDANQGAEMDETIEDTAIDFGVVSKLVAIEAARLRDVPKRSRDTTSPMSARKRLFTERCLNTRPHDAHQWDPTADHPKWCPGG